MKLVKDLQKWIEGYNELKTLADELELAFDFYKEELVTEEDVDGLLSYGRRVKFLNCSFSLGRMTCLCKSQ